MSHLTTWQTETTTSKIGQEYFNRIKERDFSTTVKQSFHKDWRLVVKSVEQHNVIDLFQVSQSSTKYLSHIGHLLLLLLLLLRFVHLPQQVVLLPQFIDTPVGLTQFGLEVVCSSDEFRLRHPGDVGLVLHVSGGASFDVALLAAVVRHVVDDHVAGRVRGRVAASHRRRDATVGSRLL